jgi:hypothetical protein
MLSVVSEAASEGILPTQLAESSRAIARPARVPRKVGNQPFRSNWLRSLSAMAWIISQRSASCCGPSHMIATFHESSWGTTEIARFVGHSLMSSISSLMAASSSSRVFAGFFKCPSLSGRQNGTTAFGYPLPPPSTDGGRWSNESKALPG